MFDWWRGALFWLAFGYGVASAVWAVLGLVALASGQAGRESAVADLLFRIGGAVVALSLAFGVFRRRPSSR